MKYCCCHVVLKAFIALNRRNVVCWRNMLPQNIHLLRLRLTTNLWFDAPRIIIIVKQWWFHLNQKSLFVLLTGNLADWPDSFRPKLTAMHRSLFRVPELPYTRDGSIFRRQISSIFPKNRSHYSIWKEELPFLKAGSSLIFNENAL